MSQRYFSPAEVNRLIPELEKIIRHIGILGDELQEKAWRLHEAKTASRRQGVEPDASSFMQEEAEVEFLRILVQTQLDRIQELGGELKQGMLIDFPGLIDGHEVSLCWRPGEETVEWYHGLTEGFRGRRRIPDAYRDPLPWEQPDPSEEQNREIH